MRFDRVTAIGTEKHEPSSGLENANHFTNRRPVILHVFDHFVAEDQVERRGRKRKKFPGRVEDVR